jgi:TorA maturation chaperone TorD
MTNREKQDFCALAAAFFAPPEPTLIEDLSRDSLRTRMPEYLLKFGGDGPVTPPFDEGPGDSDLLSSLRAEYGRLFGEPEGHRISLVESTYKQWTLDKECGMVFAASKGLLMGDPAAHMLDVYERLSLQFPEEFRSMPDHLVLELEFLAMLYQSASREVIDGFIDDHLDWIPELVEQIEMADPHPFYRNAAELIRLFLQNERNEKNIKDVDHGEKGIR